MKELNTQLDCIQAVNLQESFVQRLQTLINDYLTAAKQEMEHNCLKKEKQLLST